MSDKNHYPCSYKNGCPLGDKCIAYHKYEGDNEVFIGTFPWNKYSPETGKCKSFIPKTTNRALLFFLIWANAIIAIWAINNSSYFTDDQAGFSTIAIIILAFIIGIIASGTKSRHIEKWDNKIRN